MQRFGNNQFKNSWTKLEDDILIENFENSSYETLLQLLPNRTRSSIYQRGVKVFKLYKKYRQINWSNDQLKFLYENYENGRVDDIVKYLQKNWHSIQEYARKRGLQRKVICPFRVGNRIRDGKPNLSPLLEDVLESYYWMGYLMADGYLCHKLSQVVLASASDGLNQLEKYAKYVNAKVKIYNKSSSGFSTENKEQIRVSVAHKGIAEQIAKKFDWKHKKTYFPPNVEILETSINNKERFCSFFAGFIDGDGCIYKSGMIKIENHNHWQLIHLWFQKKLSNYFNGFTGSVCTNKRGYSVFISGQTCMNREIKRILIKLKVPIFERKWDRLKIYE